MSERYKKSEEWLERSLKSIPLGTQTFSKSKTQYPWGISPFFIKTGKGSHVWDLDGNEYIDMINSLAAVTLGYNDPDVNNAVKTQLDEGIIFSLPHPLETLVAEEIIAMVPSAEMVRFGKNGSDATAGAIRLARAHTNRDRVAVCGYHGWQDWYIGATARNRGVPESVRKLTHTFAYNDLDSLRKLFQEWPDQFAVVIMEPMNVVEPAPGFLAEAKALAHKHGALFVFDETITGFRFSNGGAQEYFNVVPDLSTFGKGVANGYPLSVLAGRADLMRLMEEIFFSFTFGGETLSLAAALATLQKLRREPVVATLRKQGQKIIDGARSLIQAHALNDVLSIAGNPTWSFLLFKDAPPYQQWQIKTLFLQEMFARGVLIIGTHNMSYSHSDDDIKKVLAAYDQVFPILALAVRERKLETLLKCKPLEPLFKVR
jgi:glutamate-1-semialdehyde 2,1-aminomutase